MRQPYTKFKRMDLPPNQNFSATNPPDFNDETKSAMREARLISEGKIPSKSFKTVDELLEDLMSDADD